MLLLCTCQNEPVVLQSLLTILSRPPSPTATSPTLVAGDQRLCRYPAWSAGDWRFTRSDVVAHCCFARDADDRTNAVGSRRPCTCAVRRRRSDVRCDTHPPRCTRGTPRVSSLTRAISEIDVVCRRDNNAHQSLRRPRQRRHCAEPSTPGAASRLRAVAAECARHRPESQQQTRMDFNA